ncbi:hypothetical protein LXL04_029490 [Taraxacum kok-saghyz]
MLGLVASKFAHDQKKLSIKRTSKELENYKEFKGHKSQRFQLLEILLNRFLTQTNEISLI